MDCRRPRIVSLISSATEMLFAIGAGDLVVAISHECDYPAEATSLPRATRSVVDSSQSSEAIDEQVKALCSSGSTLYTIEADLIRRLQPDLIVTQAQCDVCAVRYADVIDLVGVEPTLQRTQVLPLNPMSLDDVLADMLRIGDAVERFESATACVQALHDRIAALRRKTDSLSIAQRARVACIEWTQPLMFAANWTPRLIEMAGGQSGLAIAGRHSRYSTWDELIAYDPEVLIVAPCGFDLPRSLHEANLLRDTPGWDQITAVKNGRTWVVDGNAYLNRAGPRLVDSLEILGHLIQPELIDRPQWASHASPPWMLMPGR